MARFFGRYEHSLDDKGRLILPSKFRAPFRAEEPNHGFLTPNTDGCLALWTPEEFEVQMTEMQQRVADNPADRNMVRMWASTAHEVEVDRQGRIAVPSRLRDFAALSSDVLVLGAIDRIELWDPTRWEEKVAPEEQRLVSGTLD